MNKFLMIFVKKSLILFGYFLLGVSTNQFEKSMASIYLGDDKESAILSLKDLQSIKKTKPKDTLYVEGMGGG